MAEYVYVGPGSGGGLSLIFIVVLIAFLVLMACIFSLYVVIIIGNILAFKLHGFRILALSVDALVVLGMVFSTMYQKQFAFTKDTTNDERLVIYKEAMSKFEDLDFMESNFNPVVCMEKGSLEASAWTGTEKDTDFYSAIEFNPFIDRLNKFFSRLDDMDSTSGLKWWFLAGLQMFFLVSGPILYEFKYILLLVIALEIFLIIKHKWS